MIERLNHKVLITPEDIKPSTSGYKVIGAFNPAAIRVGREIYLLVRVAERPVEEREGYFPSPRAVKGKGKMHLVTEWFPIRYDHGGDVREYCDDRGFNRLSFISHLRLVKLDESGFQVKYIADEPTFYPQEFYEEFGVEDARLSEIDGKYYFTYVAVSRKMGVCTALAETEDFINFTRLGVIFCLENKDVVLLSEKVNGKYVAYHRPVGASRFDAPAMQIAYSPDLIHWGEHAPLLSTRPDQWDSLRMGAGPPPIKTDRGWLEIYHGVRQRDMNDPVGVYRAGAALFDLQDPGKLIARSQDPILEPVEEHEINGFVGGVIFPTGIVMDESKENIILYSGGADSVVTATKVALRDIFDSLKS